MLNELLCILIIRFANSFRIILSPYNLNVLIYILTVYSGRLRAYSGFVIQITVYGKASLKKTSYVDCIMLSKVKI
jgi:hypothetical protein